MKHARDCLNCGRHLSGRTDKKFCADICRNTFNNKVRCNISPSIRLVNTILKRNRDILQRSITGSLHAGRTRKLHLEAQGFNFSFFTGARKRKNGSLFFHCYEFGYGEIDEDWYYVVKREEVNVG